VLHKSSDRKQPRDLPYILYTDFICFTLCRRRYPSRAALSRVRVFRSMKCKADQKAIPEARKGVSIRAEPTLDGWVSRITVGQPLAPLPSNCRFPLLYRGTCSRRISRPAGPIPLSSIVSSNPLLRSEMHASLYIDRCRAQKSNLGWPTL